ncbi:MAG: HEAT repeat domain-containing protein [bacterium]|nr:HEAT repeat domain-containing protein [bacterium]
MENALSRQDESLNSDILGHPAIDQSMMGSFYFESIINLMNADQFSKEKSQLLREFMISISNPDKMNASLGKSFGSYLSAMDEVDRNSAIQHAFDMMIFIGCKYAKLLPCFMDALKSVMKHYASDIPNLSYLIKLCGRVGRSREQAVDDILDTLVDLTNLDRPVVLLKSITLSLHEIGLAYENKKRVFVPLLKIVKHSDPDLRISAIRSIRTQLSGQWDKPVKILKDVVLYDDEFEVRQAAVMALGEAGEYRSFALRDTVFSLVDEISDQVNNMRRSIIESENSGQNAFHVRCRFMDSKEVLKLLYHYTKTYR